MSDSEVPLLCEPTLGILCWLGGTTRYNLLISAETQSPPASASITSQNSGVELAGPRHGRNAAPAYQLWHNTGANIIVKISCTCLSTPCNPCIQHKGDLL